MNPELQDRWLIVAALTSVVIIAFFLVIGIGNDRTKATPVQVSQPSGSGSLNAGAIAPDFTATAFDGSVVKLSALKGKVVLVNFFASWCVECRAEMPAIQSTYAAKHAAGFEVIGVNTWDSGDGKAFYQQVGATFPAVFDPQQGQQPGGIAHAFGIDTPALPISIFIDRDGRIHQAFPGGIDANLIKKQLGEMGIS